MLDFYHSCEHLQAAVGHAVSSPLWCCFHNNPIPIFSRFSVGYDRFPFPVVFGAVDLLDVFSSPVLTNHPTSAMKVGQFPSAIAGTFCPRHFAPAGMMAFGGVTGRWCCEGAGVVRSGPYHRSGGNAGSGNGIP